MKKTIVCAVAMAGLTAFADASRAVVTMVDGSNVKGVSLIDKIGDNVPELKSWAFYDCPNLRSVEFGSGLKKIGDWSFDQDRSLVSVTIPAGVIRIGEGAFNGCSSLMEVKMEGSVEHIGSRAFSGTPWGRSQSVIP